MAGYAHYYVNDNAQPNGDHEVHREGCYWLALVNSKSYLGYFEGCRPAVTKARQSFFTQSNGCAFCSSECHTS